MLPRDLISFRIPLIDGEGNSAESLTLAIRSVASLLASRVPALVCCGAGMSRAPCIVAAAMAIHRGVPASECLAEIGRLRPVDASSGLWRDVTSLLPSLRVSVGIPVSIDERLRDATR